MLSSRLVLRISARHVHKLTYHCTRELVERSRKDSFLPLLAREISDGYLGIPPKETGFLTSVISLLEPESRNPPRSCWVALEIMGSVRSRSARSGPTRSLAGRPDCCRIGN